MRTRRTSRHSGNGSQSRIYKTTDAGATWTLQFTNPDSAGFYDCMDFWDARRGIVIGDALGRDIAILRTSDAAGATWAAPPRLASIDQETQSWQQKIRRVGQSNMTEHDPAVMNIEAVGRLLALRRSGHRLYQCHWHSRVLSLEGAVPSPWEIPAMAAISSASAWPPRRSATCAWSRA